MSGTQQALSRHPHGTQTAKPPQTGPGPRQSAALPVMIFGAHASHIRASRLPDSRPSSKQKIAKLRKKPTPGPHAAPCAAAVEERKVPCLLADA